MQSIKSEKANPPKGGDAKPWVYHHAVRGHDSQVAEDENTRRSWRAWQTARLVFWNLIIRSIKANPSKDGDAKPWVYHHASRDHDSQAADMDEPQSSPVELSAFIEKEISIGAQIS